MIKLTFFLRGNPPSPVLALLYVNSPSDNVKLVKFVP